MCLSHLKVYTLYCHPGYAHLRQVLTAIICSHGGMVRLLRLCITNALARETWSENSGRIWQAEELTKLLQLAATQVPYYRDYWQRRRNEGDIGSWEKLENWPILTKEALREKHQKHLLPSLLKQKGFLN